MSNDRFMAGSPQSETSSINVASYINVALGTNLIFPLRTSAFLLNLGVKTIVVTKQ